MAARKRDIEASKVGILKAREESDKKRRKGTVDEENGKGTQHIWGHLRRLRVWSMEAGETGKAGRDRPALVWQLLCARRSILSQVLALPSSTEHLGPQNHSHPFPSDRKLTDLFELFLNTHTRSREVSFFMMPHCLWQEEATWQDDKEVLGSGGFVHLLAPLTGSWYECRYVPSISLSLSFVLPKVGLMMDPTLRDTVMLK